MNYDLLVMMFKSQGALLFLQITIFFSSFFFKYKLHLCDCVTSLKNYYALIGLVFSLDL